MTLQHYPDFGGVPVVIQIINTIGTHTLSRSRGDGPLLFNVKKYVLDLSSTSRISILIQSILILTPEWIPVLIMFNFSDE